MTENVKIIFDIVAGDLIEITSTIANFDLSLLKRSE